MALGVNGYNAAFKAFAQFAQKKVAAGQLKAVARSLSSCAAEAEPPLSVITSAAGDKKASRDGETTASLRKKAAALVVEIIGTVNALNRISASDATAAAAQKLDAIVVQYKNVATNRKSSKKDDPEPENAAATAS